MGKEKMMPVVVDNERLENRTEINLSKKTYTPPISSRNYDVLSVFCRL